MIIIVMIKIRRKRRRRKRRRNTEKNYSNNTNNPVKQRRIYMSMRNMIRRCFDVLCLLGKTTALSDLAITL